MFSHLYTCQTIGCRTFIRTNVFTPIYLLDYRLRAFVRTNVFQPICLLVLMQRDYIPSLFNMIYGSQYFHTKMYVRHDYRMQNICQNQSFHNYRPVRLQVVEHVLKPMFSHLQACQAIGCRTCIRTNVFTPIGLLGYQLQNMHQNQCFHTSRPVNLQVVEHALEPMFSHLQAYQAIGCRTCVRTNVFTPIGLLGYMLQNMLQNQCFHTYRPVRLLVVEHSLEPMFSHL